MLDPVKTEVTTVLAVTYKGCDTRKVATTEDVILTISFTELITILCTNV